MTGICARETSGENERENGSECVKFERKDKIFSNAEKIHWQIGKKKILPNAV